MLLAALVELYHDARENDVRLGILRITLQALQRHGNLLSSSKMQPAILIVLPALRLTFGLRYRSWRI